VKSTSDKIALLHHTGGGNLGDDATLDVVVSNIRQRQLDADIVIISMNPTDTEDRHGVRSLPIRRHTWGIGYSPERIGPVQAKRSRLRNWLQVTRNPAIRLPRAIFGEMAFLAASYQRLKEFDQLVVSGGGQLTERSGPWGFPYGIFIWVILAKLARLKCVFLSVGAGPLKHPLSRFLVARALSMADYVSFRDTQSRDLAREVGFSGKCQVVPDNAYLLEHPASHISPASQRPVVGIAPMPYPFCDPREFVSGHQKVYDAYISKFATFASMLVKESCSLELFGSDVGADSSAIDDLRKCLRDQHDIVTPPYEPVTSVEGLLAKMETFDCVVTCRFHGVVLAHILNKPILAISHHPKVANLMEQLGLEQYCVDIQTYDPVHLAKSFKSLRDHEAEIRQSMAASLAMSRLRVASQFDELFPSTGMEENRGSSDRMLEVTAVGQSIR
jgi:polysaccharide pyruvyl transferase WcaK-like protein